MNWENFQQKWSPDPQTELNASLRKWAKIALSTINTPEHQIESTPIMHGTLWNVGFVPEGQDLKEMPVNWTDVDAAVSFITGVTNDLAENGCYHSSMGDSAYYPIVFLEPLENLPEDLLHALRTPIPLQEESDENLRKLREGGSLLMLEGALQSAAEYGHEVSSVSDLNEEERAELEEYLSDEEIEVYERVQEKLDTLHELQSWSILGGFDHFPSLQIGKHSSGLWVGLLVLESDQYAYTD